MGNKSKASYLKQVFIYVFPAYVVYFFLSTELHNSFSGSMEYGVSRKHVSGSQLTVMDPYLTGFFLA